MKLVLTEEARADLVRIADWIARDSPRRAVTFVDEVEAHCVQIPNMRVRIHSCRGARQADCAALFMATT